MKKNYILILFFSGIIILSLYYRLNKTIEKFKISTDKLYISYGNQLGNCLRSIISGLIIAEHFNLTPVIDADNSSKHSEKEEIIISQLFSKYISINVRKEACSKIKIIHSLLGTNYDLINEGRVINIEEGDICLNSNIYSIIPGNMSESEYIREKLFLYRTLDYPQLLLKTVEKFNKKYNLKDSIGVHIRYMDNLNDKAKQSINTSLEIFIGKIKSYKNKTILLCSDSKEVLENKSILDCNNTIILADKYSDKIYQSFYEMMLLSCTKRIIGSTSSTFSYESAFIRGTDIELYEDKKWVLYEISKYIN
jgi:hypothetical protein